MKKTNKRKPNRKTSVRKRRPDTAELIQTADRLGLKLYAVEGLTNERQRKMESLQKIQEGGMTFDKFQDEDWILMSQAIRERGAMSPDEIFAGIDNAVDNIAWKDAGLIRLSNAIDAMYKAYGAKDDEHWPVGEGPDEFEKLRTAFDQRFFQLQVAILRHHGEDDMADLLEKDMDAYAARVEAGQALAEKRHSDRAAAGIPGPVK
jgi:hypothetical protein